MRADHGGPAAGGVQVQRQGAGVAVGSEGHLRDQIDQALAARADQDGVRAGGQVRQGPQQREVVLQGLAEADAGVQQHVRHAGAQGLARLGPQVTVNLRDHVGVVGGVLHGLRVALHVHHAGGRSGVGAHAAHLGVAQAGHVVDQVRPGAQGPGSHLGFHGVHAEQHVRAAQGADDGQHPVEFLVGRDWGRAGPGAFPADVQDGHPGPAHGLRGGQGVLQGRVASAVAETVRRDVQDAHDGRAGPAPLPAARGALRAGGGAPEGQAVRHASPRAAGRSGRRKLTSTRCRSGKASTCAGMRRPDRNGT